MEYFGGLPALSSSFHSRLLLLLLPLLYLLLLRSYCKHMIFASAVAVVVVVAFRGSELVLALNCDAFYCCCQLNFFQRSRIVAQRRGVFVALMGGKSSGLCRFITAVMQSVRRLDIIAMRSHCFAR